MGSNGMVTGHWSGIIGLVFFDGYVSGGGSTTGMAMAP